MGKEIKPLKCRECGKPFLCENCEGCCDYGRGLCSCNNCFGEVEQYCGKELTIKQIKPFVFR
jgi:hypothetical protein